MNVRARLKLRCGMDTFARLDGGLAKAIEAVGAAGIIRRVHGAAQHADQAQVQGGGDQIDGAEVHDIARANPARGR